MGLKLNHVSKRGLRRCSFSNYYSYRFITHPVNMGYIITKNNYLSLYDSHYISFWDCYTFFDLMCSARCVGILTSCRFGNVLVEARCLNYVQHVIFSFHSSGYEHGICNIWSTLLSWYSIIMLLNTNRDVLHVLADIHWNDCLVWPVA